MGALTVLYDDECGICTRLALWLEARPGMSVAPIDSDVGTMPLRDLSPAERIASVHVIDASSRRSSGGAALVPLLRRLPLGRFPVAAIETLPALGDGLYRLVARHRRTLSRLAGLDSCRVPKHEDRHVDRTARIPHEDMARASRLRE
jgi:predicted DCC family thiol-disulfide oxidoreductase YuxK